MKKFLKNNWMILCVMLLTVCLYAWVYRGIIFGNKILFPSNFLAQFYSPWVTQKFKGWDAGIPHKPIGTDQIRFFYPSRTFTNEMFTKHELPLWNPYVFAGNAHAADVQSAVWYPLNILYIFLSQINAWQLLVISQSIFAFVFMYMYVRVISANSLASWVSGIAFGLSGFYVAWSGENMSVGHAGVWLPLVLWSIEQFDRSKRFRYIVVGSLGLAASLLAGFFQLSVYLYVLIAAYIIGKYFQTKKSSIDTIILWGVMMVITIGIAAISLVPSFEAYTLSPRATSDIAYLFHTYLLPMTHLVQSLSPDIFGNPGSYNYFGRGFYHETVLFIGLVPMLFALFAIKNIKSNWYIKFFLWASISTFFLTQDNPVTRGIFQLPIPLFSTFLPSRILYLTTFSLSVLAGMGFNLWQKEKKPFPYWVIGIVISLLGICIVYALAIMKIPQHPILQAIHSYILQQSFIEPRHGIVMLRNVLLSLGTICAFFVATRSFVPKIISIICVIILIAFGQFYTLQKYIVVGEPEFLYPPNPVISYLQSHQGENRFLSLGSPILGNLSTQFKLYSAEGLDPMFSSRYGELVYAATHQGKLEKNIPRIEVEFSSMNDRERMSDNSYRLRLMNLLGVKNVAYFQNEQQEKSMTLPVRFSESQFIPRWQNDRWYVFENTTVLPRAVLMHNYVVLTDSQEILNKIYDPALKLTDTVVLEEEPIGFRRLNSSKDISTVNITQYGPSRVEMKTDSDQDKILFLSDAYHVGWRAYIDGSEVKILRANYAFRAVVVPRGVHTVTFLYKPASFIWGVWVSIGSIVTLILLWAMRKLWYNNERKRNLK